MMKIGKKLALRTIALSIVPCITALTMFAFFSGSGVSRNPESGKDGHRLTELWTEYGKAVDQDRPKKQAEILSKIKEEASEKRILWDFYDASEKYVSAVSSRNWKLRDSLKAQFREDVKNFNEPLVSFVWMLRNPEPDADSVFRFVQKNSRTLKAGRNGAFYTVGSASRYGGLSGLLSADFLPEFYSNDYDYALWQLLPFTSSGRMTEGGIYAALKDYEGESYPLGAYLEYLTVRTLPAGNKDLAAARKAALEAFAGKYGGKAVSMFAKSDLLSIRFNELNDARASGGEFRAFYDECRSFEAERSGFRGDEAVIVKNLESVAGIIRTLTAKEIDLQVKDGKILVLLRNLKSADVTMFPGGKTAEKILDTKASVPSSGFYVPDTVTVDIPELNDGEYSIEAKNGKFSANQMYASYRISLAKRTDARGICIYAADYKSGEPVIEADLELKKNGKVIAGQNGFKFDGFTPIPEALSSKIAGDSYYELICSFRGGDGFLRSSDAVAVRGYDIRKENSAEKNALSLQGEIFTDRGAYNPGDTLDFKAVMFHTDFLTSAGTAEKGLKCKAVLQNAEGKEVDSMTLTTNEFGSVAGRFAIPEGGRNGYWSLSVEADSGYGNVNICRTVRVDEFILPTFDVAFDQSDRLYLPGDNVVVSGKVTNYSGHPVSSENSEYEVRSYGRMVASGRLEMNADGTFRVEFTAEPESGRRMYNVCVRITDATGETHEYSKSVRVANSVNVSLSLGNRADGEVNSLDDGSRAYDSYAGSPVLLREEKASVLMKVSSQDGVPVPADIRYVLSDGNGKVLLAGDAESGAEENIDMSGYPSGLYLIRADASARSASGKEYTDTSRLQILLVRDSDRVLDAPVRDLIMPSASEVAEGKPAEIVFGTADGAPVWAVAEVFGDNAELLESRFVRISGERGKDGSLVRLPFDYRADYPEAIRIQIFYFKDASCVSSSHEFHRARTSGVLPLEFSSFEDKACPASSCTFTVKTLPGVECLAAVFDKSTETIAANNWNTFSLNAFHVNQIWVDSSCGRVGGSYSVREESVTGFGASLKARTRVMFSANAASLAMEDSAELSAATASEAAPASDAGDNVSIREKFSNTLAFLPFLRSDGEGNISFNVNTSDKLSTYCVSLYAHDTGMRNAALRGEMTVTVPVKVSIAAPEYLYAGDEYVLSAAVSSVAEATVEGTVTLSVYGGSDYSGTPLLVRSSRLAVPAGKSVNALFDVDVKSLLQAAPADTLGFKAVFRADGGTDPETGRVSPSFSDGMFVPVPVLPAVQTLTEAHSAVLLAGMDRDSLIADLRSRFVNVSGEDAECRLISIIDMIRDAIPSKVEPAGKDVLSLSESMYVRALADQLTVMSRRGLPADGPAPEMSDAELKSGVFSCRNADGGFGWFEGMESSPVITAVLLERFGKMRSSGLLDEAETVNAGGEQLTLGEVLESAVKYVDSSHFSGQSAVPVWRGGLSDEQYMYVRSMFCNVPFGVKASGSAPAGLEKRLKEFRSGAKDYLTPKKVRGMNGYILGKARRITILRNLLASDGGSALAKAWGISLNTGSRLSSSLDADMVSLLEYAVEHRDGGIYYPNAVMPFRGLLESEAYAHSMLCDLLTGYASDNSGSSSRETASRASEAASVADGIRIWLMLQKETQRWDESPAFVDAVNSVMNGSGKVKSTSVVSLSRTYTSPVSGIKSAGNGFAVERRFYRETADTSAGKDTGKISRTELKPGDTINVGDRIIAEYSISNGENRSFVRLTAPREAAFRPVNQLSGHCGWGTGLSGLSGRYSVVPQGYRNVKSALTEYYFDSYPEGKTVVTEEMYAVQAGVFSAPAVSVESMYAPHYRANGAFSGQVSVEFRAAE